MKCETQVTFEFNINPPITVKSIGEAGNPQAIARRALKEAQSQHKGLKWSSIVILLIRLDSSTDIEDQLLGESGEDES